MMNVNVFEQCEWWVSSGLWYPPIATRVQVTDLDLLYRETGLVRVRTANGAISIWWDVEHVEADSLGTVIDYLDGERYEALSVTLHFFKVGWMEECYGNPAAAVRRMEQIETFRDVELLPETRVHQLPISEISFSSTLLRQAFAAFGAANWFDRMIGGRLALSGLFFNRPDRADGLTFSFVGPESECARMLGQTWRSQAIGTPADGAFADEHFDRRISSSYERALSRREPLLEHIVGLIDVGPHLIWLPYQRLLLPDGDRLACFTSITQDLAKPFLSHQVQ